MKHSELTHKKNKQLLKLLWGSWILSLILLNMLKIDFKSGASLFITGFTICLMLTFLIWKRKFVKQTMYLFAISTVIITYLVIRSAPVMTIYIVVFYALAMLSLYENMYIMLLTGTSFIGLMNYFYFLDETSMLRYSNIEVLWIYCSVILLMTIILAILGKFRENMSREIEKNSEQIKIANEKNKEILERIKDLIGILGKFSTELKEDIGFTENVSNEVINVFSDLANGVQSQTDSVNDVSCSLQSNVQEIDKLIETSNNMNRLSQLNITVIKEGDKKIKELVEKINNVSSTINLTSDLMNSLNEQTEKIYNILKLINDISDRTNLLALNAAIEAARAGEAGKGFSVVSDEIRDLAENSSKSVNKISNILKELQIKSQKVTNEIITGIKNVNDSIKSTEYVKEYFEKINTNTKDMTNQSEKIDGSINEFGNSTDVIKDEVLNIFNVSQETSASVEEILARMSEQNNRIEKINMSFKELQQMIVNVQSMV